MAALPYDVNEALRHLTAQDPKLAPLFARVGSCTLSVPRVVDPFESLTTSIVYQQLHGKAAATILGRVRALYPGKKFFTPEQLLKTKDEPLRGAGLSRNKLLALRDLAAKVQDGTVPKAAALRKLSDDDIVERLTEVRGIGRWTVEMLLIFRLGRPDVLPVDDYGVRKGFSLHYKKRERVTPKQLLQYGERWRPFRSVASWYMWRVLDTP